VVPLGSVIFAERVDEKGKAKVMGRVPYHKGVQSTMQPRAAVWWYDTKHYGGTSSASSFSVCAVQSGLRLVMILTS
jgi:hypothetical protein